VPRWVEKARGTANENNCGAGDVYRSLWISQKSAASGIPPKPSRYGSHPVKGCASISVEQPSLHEQVSHCDTNICLEHDRHCAVA
jgi:hypothetical protein